MAPHRSPELPSSPVAETVQQMRATSLPIDLLPHRFRRLPLSEEEIECIRVSGLKGHHNGTIDPNQAAIEWRSSRRLGPILATRQGRQITEAS